MVSKKEPSATKSTTPTTLEKFLALRKLTLPAKRAPDSTARDKPDTTTAPVKTLSKTSVLPQSTVWKRYSKRVHGERVAALRAATRAPDDDSSDSRDAYNPKKPSKRFIKLHAEEEQVSIEFNVHTRAMFFEREQVDRDVCDRLENRHKYDAQLKQLYSEESHLIVMKKHSPEKDEPRVVTQ